MATEETTREPALVVIGTPIGNLGDISERAIRELREVDLICCEDTRRTGKLLNLLNITPRPDFEVLNEHTEEKRANEILNRITAGLRVALVTDAGMPGIADPGQYLIKSAIDHEINLEIVPGPTAGIVALIASGLPTSRFVFQGFIPRKGVERQRRIEEIARDDKTTVIYESGKRIERTIEDLLNVCGDERGAIIARELTKMHEEIQRGTLRHLYTKMSDISTKGEFVLILSGFSEDHYVSDSLLKEELQEIIGSGKSKRDAVKELTSKYQLSKRRVYDLSIEISVDET
ncbi:MAG: 16S rRNA (cytidine(1402)-2'-O)-methyltransferase [Acidimicrobiaceae bacterium]|nr:16S rRNA (cytidine(1402)-2'-O)-methyltransferase [Acidimicrobiaceae bacterium]|tara:strand:+ start:3340 stop:4206 length:867 start_codon:yes stop_codon:yes gene_type:complete